MQISSFVSDPYIINLCLGYQLCLICPLILLYFLTLLHRHPGIFSPYVWTLPSKSYLPLCLIQEYSYLCGLGGDVTQLNRINIIQKSLIHNALSFLLPHTAGLACLSGLSTSQRFRHRCESYRGSRWDGRRGKPASVRSTATGCQLLKRLPPN